MKWFARMRESFRFYKLARQAESVYRNNPVRSHPEAIVLGNGPSLNGYLQEILEKRVGRDIWAVNFFALSEDYFRVRPERYVFIDHRLWLEDVLAEFRNNREQLLHNLFEQTDWDLEVFLPYQAKELVESRLSRLELRPNVKLHYINIFPISDVDPRTFRLFDDGVGMVAPWNVLVAVIFLCARAGYFSCFVFGADHDIHRNIYTGMDNVVYVAQKHFYDKEKEYVPYFKDCENTLTMAELFDGWAKLYRAYENLSKYCEHRGLEVLVVGEESSLDVFKKIHCEDMPRIQP